MDDPPSENESQLALKLKKSLRLNKKLQEKIDRFSFIFQNIRKSSPKA
jgi:hypothetical protein